MCAECHWAVKLEQIKRMSGDAACRWAYDTLSDIGKKVEKYGHITPNMSRAITNIANAASRGPKYEKPQRAPTYPAYRPSGRSPNYPVPRRPDSGGPVEGSPGGTQ